VLAGQKTYQGEASAAIDRLRTALALGAVIPRVA
jgi:hypothetical protein